MALAWQRGADPFCVYNCMDAAYRPLSEKHPCPACFSIRRDHKEPCAVCNWRGFVELPLDKPGEPIPPPHPRRMRNFIYGIAVAVDERQQRSGVG